MDRSSYFLVRVAAAGDGSRRDPLAGSIQRLGTGEDVAFADDHELLAIIGRWAARPSKMPRSADPGNHPAPGSEP